MRLPQVVSVREGPYPSGGLAPNLGLWAAPAAAAAKGFQGLADVALKAGELRGEAERAKREQAAKLEAAQLQAQIELDLAMQDADLKATVQDPDDYWRQRTAQLRAVQDGLSTRVRDPETLPLLAPHVERAIGRAVVEARRHHDARFKDRTLGQLAVIEDTQAILAGQTALDDDATFAERFQAAVSAINTARPLLGDEKAEERILALRRRLLDERATRHVDQDPAGFLATLPTPRYSFLDPKRRDGLVVRAEQKIAAQQAEAVRAKERFEKTVAEDYQAAQRALITELDARAFAGTLTLTELQTVREQGWFDDTDGNVAFRRLAERLTSPRDIASDPATLADLSARVHRSVPAASTEEVWALHRQGRLSDKDATRLADRIVSRQDHARAEARTLDSEGRARVSAAQSQAEQEIDRFVGWSPMLGLDRPELAQIHAAMFEELTARSAAFSQQGGKEDPLAVVEDLKRRYRPAVDRIAAVSAGQVREQLRFGGATPEEAAQRLEEAAARGQIQRGSAAWRQQQERIVLWRKKLGPAEPAPRSATPTPAPAAPPAPKAGGRKPFTTPPGARLWED